MKKLLIVALAFVSCGGQPKNAKIEQKKDVLEIKNDKFISPEIPVMLTDPGERAQYFVKNYWNNYNFKDTSLISRPEITEQAFAEFVNILPHAANYVEGLSLMMKKAEVDSVMFAHFLSMSEKYFYDPNSPFRCTEYYVEVLKVVLSSDKVDDINKIRPQHQYDMSITNRVGEKATMFPALAKAKGELILLFFFNPDCKMCSDVKDYISDYKIDEKLTVLMVNPEENKYLEDVYDLRAIPNLYLLDKNKRVILRDTDIRIVEKYLSEKQTKL